MITANDFKRICVRHLQERAEFIEKYKETWSREPAGMMFDEEAWLLFIKEHLVRHEKLLKEIIHECNDENLIDYIKEYDEFLEKGQVVNKNYLRNIEVLH